MQTTALAITLLLTGLLAACAGTPQSDNVAANATSGTTKEPEPGSDDELVCEYEKVIGSHFKKRVCMTRSDREQLRMQTQEAMRADPTVGNTSN